MTCVLDDVERNQINKSDEQPPHYICFLILLSVALVKIFLELSSTGHDARKKCLLGVRQSESQTSLLARKLKFCSQQVYMILLKKQTTKLLMRLRGCASWSAPLLLQITQDRFSQSRPDCYMCHFTRNAQKIRCEIGLL